jgi:hypothetical protein
MGKAPRASGKAYGFPIDQGRDRVGWRTSIESVLSDGTGVLNACR